jgi:hypothetical protein
MLLVHLYLTLHLLTYVSAVSFASTADAAGALIAGQVHDIISKRTLDSICVNVFGPPFPSRRWRGHGTEHQCQRCAA